MDWVWLDDRLVKKGQAKISCLSEAVLYGQGLFETMRCYQGRVFALERHLARLLKSCRVLGLAAPAPGKIEEALSGLIEKNKLQDAYLRLNLLPELVQRYNNFLSAAALRGCGGVCPPRLGGAQSRRRRDAEGGLAPLAEVLSYQQSSINLCNEAPGRFFIFAKPLSLPGPARYLQGFAVMLCREERIGSSILFNHKTTSRYFYQRLFALAQGRGFDEALFLNSYGELVEGSRSNVFLIKKGKVWTPQTTCGCLGGVTREIVIGLCAKMKVKVLERRLRPADLLGAQEVFLTNSLIEVMPVTRLDRRPVAGGKPGPLTTAIMLAYKKEVEKSRSLG